MTFTEIQTEITDRLRLTSADSISRIGRAINVIYKRVTTSLGLQVARRTTVSAVTTVDSRSVTFTGVEKVLSVYRIAASGAVTILDERHYEELREITPKEGIPTAFAVGRMNSGSVQIFLDTIADEIYSLSADGLETADTLSGSQVPAFPESFHDILVEGVLADELRKEEKPGLAAEARNYYEQRLSDLRLHIAVSPYKDTYQGKTASRGSSGFSGGGSGSGSGSIGSSTYTQTGLVTFDRDPSAPFAVSAGSAKVDNLDADLLDGLSSAAFMQAGSASTITGLLTFDRDPSAPFAVTAGSAKVDNLDADLLDGLSSAAFAQKAANETISGNWTHSGTLTASNAGNTLAGAGSGITALNASNLASGTVPDARFPATLPAASGVNLTALNATNLASGTVPDARFPATLPAASGANLTALNATNLASGTVPDARFPATLPAASGVNLTALNATNLASGTVPDGRFPATLPAASGANLTSIPVGALANGTDGELITWNSSGVAATVAVGTATHVLTSNGTGAAPTFQAPSTITSATQLPTSGEWPGEDVTVSAGGGTESFKFAGAFDVDDAFAQTGANTTETILKTVTVPANSLNADGRTIRLTAVGATANNSNNKTIRVRWGGIGGTIVSVIGPDAYDTGKWRIVVEISRIASNSQGFMSLASLTSNGLAINGPDLGTSAQTDSGAITLVLTGQNGTAAAGDITFSRSLAEFLN